MAAAIAAGLRAGEREAVELPVADGGEGTMDVLVDALGGERRTATVSDPLGRPIEARFGLLPDGSAVVETAQASGLGLVAEDERDAWAASTRGTGELIVAAAEAGADARARDGRRLGHDRRRRGRARGARGGRRRAPSSRCSATCARPSRRRRACSARRRAPTRSSSSGSRGASTSSPESFERDPRGEPMTGAAGGLSGGLWGGRGARLVPGAPYVLDAIGFDALMRESAFVVTGEGRLDSQTLAGKIVGEVATRCRQAGVTCHAIVGSNSLDPFDERIIDLASVTEATNLEEMKAAGRALV